MVDQLPLHAVRGLGMIDQLLRALGAAGRIGQYDFEQAAPGHLFHDQCGYAWTIHDNRDRRSVLPFGCPPDETTAQRRWGYGDLWERIEHEADRIDAVVNGNG